MPVSSLTHNLTDQQLIDMSPGGRLDVGKDAPWQARVFAHVVGEPGWRQQGVESGTRSEMEARSPIIAAGLNAMAALGIIDGDDLFIVPKGWVSGDGFAYPPADEIAEELANRHI